MSIFDRRESLKPFEYPDVVPFRDAINHSYWLVSEWSFTSDVDDFKTRLTPAERAAATRAMLAISQIELPVKRFWGRVGDRLPKPEIEQVGATFMESEVRHQAAYSHLLEVLGLNAEFDAVLAVPAFAERAGALKTAIAAGLAGDDRDFTASLTLFSLFVENVSLFGQFAVMKGINHARNCLKDVDNVIQATLREENLHALFGVWLVRTIRRERPEWFDAAFYARITALCVAAYEGECRLLDWIFAEGELPFLPKATVREFVKLRVNESLTMIGGAAPFGIDDALLAPLRWFVEELHGDTSTDFFHKRPVTYSKKMRPITAEELF